MNDLLSHITTYEKYSRWNYAANRRETFDEIISRRQDFDLQRFEGLNIENLIYEAYDLVNQKKVMPSMRSLQYAGDPITKNPARAYNCCFLHVSSPRAFSEAMFLLLSGVGVGFSVQKHHVERLPLVPKISIRSNTKFVIPDSIEGWADAVKHLVKCFLFEGRYPIFDYSEIRPEGMPISSGGHAPGPAPLKKALELVTQIFLEVSATTQKLSPINCHDIICILSDCVMAGGIRRAALISLFSPDDKEMLLSKTPDQLSSAPWRYRANNSAVFLRSQLDRKIFDYVFKINEEYQTGEPGIFFTNCLEKGTNPCVEIGLDPNQFCNLTEVAVNGNLTQEELNYRVKMAARIGTMQAALTNFTYLNPDWITTTRREALLGVGLTGIAAGNVLELNLQEAAQVVLEENAFMAKKLGINIAARTTCVKPAGSTSIVMSSHGDGVHACYAEYYLRRVRLRANAPLGQYLKATMPEVLEKSFEKPDDELILTIPIKSPDNSKYGSEDTLTEFLPRVKKVFEEWVLPGHRSGMNTHNVSATAWVKKNDYAKIGDWLWDNKQSYNGMAIFPYFDLGNYPQLPKEEISKDKYDSLMDNYNKLGTANKFNPKDIKDSVVNVDLAKEWACSGGSCELVSI